MKYTQGPRLSASTVSATGTSRGRCGRRATPKPSPGPVTVGLACVAESPPESDVAEPLRPMGEGGRRAALVALSAALATGAVLSSAQAVHAAPVLPSSGCINDLPPKPQPHPFGPGDMIPKEYRLDLPYLRFLPVPEPAPQPNPVRIKSQPPPSKKRCVDPCPDITDPKKPAPSGNGSLGSLEAPKQTPCRRRSPFLSVPNPNPPKLPPPPPKVDPGWDRAPLERAAARRESGWCGGCRH